MPAIRHHGEVPHQPQVKVGWWRLIVCHDPIVAAQPTIARKSPSRELR
jgi:hypothetical protein